MPAPAVRAPLFTARPSRLDFHASVEAMFYGRLGGVSSGPFASLNTGLEVGDDPQRVQRNREILRTNCGRGVQLAGVRQVHGARVVVAAPQSANSEADALVTCDPALALVINTADCAPLFLHCLDTPAIALVHCGWRGVAARVVEASVDALASLSGRVVPSRLLAFIGPCIHRCCYEVGEEMTRVFSGDDAKAFAHRGGLALDLPALIVRRLLAIGLLAPHIEVHADCTRCRSDLYFSHRAERGVTGRNAAVMLLKTTHAAPRYDGQDGEKRRVTTVHSRR